MRVFKDPDVVGSPVFHYVRFCVILFVFYLLISATLHIKFVIIGLLSCFVVGLVCMPLFMIEDRDGKKHFLLDVSILKFLAYMVWLFKELVMANIDVAKTVWKSGLPIHPELIRFQVDWKNPIAAALLANSITLTPGTITLSFTKEGVFEIHALTPGAAQGIIDGGMLRKVAGLYHESEDFKVLEVQEKS